MKDSSAKTASDPIVGEWQMTRTDIEPDLPLPDLLINQVISEKATWKFQGNTNDMTLKFDGRDTWYKAPLGVQIDKKPTSFSSSTSKAPYVFTGGGGINLDQVSGILTQLIGLKIEKINVDFDDEISVSWVSTYSQIRAKINVNVSGSYYEESGSGKMKQESINQTITVNYEGKKK